MKTNQQNLIGLWSFFKKFTQLFLLTSVEYSSVLCSKRDDMSVKHLCVFQGFIYKFSEVLTLTRRGGSNEVSDIMSDKDSSSRGRSQQPCLDKRGHVWGPDTEDLVVDSRDGKHLYGKKFWTLQIACLYRLLPKSTSIDSLCGPSSHEGQAPFPPSSPTSCLHTKSHWVKNLK